MSEPAAASQATDHQWERRANVRRLAGVFARDLPNWTELASSLTLRAVVASRLIVWAAGLIALALFGHNHDVVAALDPNGASAPFKGAAANFIFAPAARWDSVWYLQIAHAGYFSQESSAMFPLYPLLIRGGSLIFHSELLAGLAISVASMAAGLSILERLLRADFDEQTARITVLLIAFFPVAFFFSAVYTESLFLFLSVAAIYAARRDRWALAGAIGALASATRSAGILLAVPLVLMYLYGPRTAPATRAAVRWWRPRYRIAPSLAWLVLVPVGVTAYLTYLWIAHGQPLAPFHVEQYWGRVFAGPFGGVWRAIAAVPSDVRHLLAGTSAPVGAGDPIPWSAHNLIDLGFLLFAVVGVLGAWRRIPIAYFAYAIALLAQALSFPTSTEPLSSISRYLMVIFPLFLGWALLLRQRPRVTAVALGGSGALLAVFSGLWAMWAWIA